MRKFMIVHALVCQLWKCCSVFKDKDVTQGDDCERFITEMQAICDKYHRDIGKAEGELATDVAVAIMKYLCNKE